MSDRDVSMRVDRLRETLLSRDRLFQEQRVALDELCELARRASARPSVPASAVLERKMERRYTADGQPNDIDVYLVRADAITLDHEPATPPSEGADDE